MEIPKIVQELLDKKAEMSNTVDLDAYANGLLDMYHALQLQQTGVSKCNIKLNDIIVVDVKNKHKDIWASEILSDEDGDLYLKENGVLLESIPEKWIVYIC
jgi:hypothetical protein